MFRSRKGLVGYLEKVTLALGQNWSPDFRRLVAWDFELFHEESNHSFE